MPGSSACSSTSGATRFSASVRCMASGATWSIPATSIRPALLTRCSTSRCAASSVAARRAASVSDRSTGTKRSPGSTSAGLPRLKFTTS
ncbi:Uncharacterised protein [Bordetella pertussis]|nr:Uncharacterised protein [Bordetella pertussis]